MMSNVFLEKNTFFLKKIISIEKTRVYIMKNKDTLIHRANVKLEMMRIRRVNEKRIEKAKKQIEWRWRLTRIGWTARDFSVHAGLSKSTRMSRYIRLDRIAKDEFFNKIESALDLLEKEYDANKEKEERK